MISPLTMLICIGHKGSCQYGGGPVEDIFVMKNMLNNNIIGFLKGQYNCFPFSKFSFIALL